ETRHNRRRRTPRKPSLRPANRKADPRESASKTRRPPCGGLPATQRNRQSERGAQTQTDAVAVLLIVAEVTAVGDERGGVGTDLPVHTDVGTDPVLGRREARHGETTGHRVGTRVHEDLIVLLLLVVGQADVRTDVVLGIAHAALQLVT